MLLTLNPADDLCLRMRVSAWSWNYFARMTECIFVITMSGFYLWSIIACQPQLGAGGNAVILPGSDNTEMNLNYRCCWQDSSVNTGLEHNKCKHLVLSRVFHSLNQPQDTMFGFDRSSRNNNLCLSVCVVLHITCLKLCKGQSKVCKLS